MNNYNSALAHLYVFSVIIITVLFFNLLLAEINEKFKKVSILRFNKCPSAQETH